MDKGRGYECTGLNGDGRPKRRELDFLLEFPDLATFEKARAKVRASPEFKEWTAVNAKVGNTVIDAGLFEEIVL